MKETYLVWISGERHQWVVRTHLTVEQVEDMRADGVAVSPLEYTIPLWAVRLRLHKPWVLLTDIWNFRFLRRRP